MENALLFQDGLPFKCFVNVYHFQSYRQNEGERCETPFETFFERLCFIYKYQVFIYTFEHVIICASQKN